jgi:hypothetical protein
MRIGAEAAAAGAPGRWVAAEEKVKDIRAALQTARIAISTLLSAF